MSDVFPPVQADKESRHPSQGNGGIQFLRVVCLNGYIPHCATLVDKQGCGNGNFERGVPLAFREIVALLFKNRSGRFRLEEHDYEYSSVFASSI